MQNLYKALFEFQQECPVLKKEKQGYGYLYADLPGIIDQIKPTLKKHGLAYTQLMKGKSLMTVLIHVESGENITSEFELPEVNLKGMNVYQSLGAGITYFRRYELCCILGIIGDDDKDANDIPNEENGEELF